MAKKIKNNRLQTQPEEKMQEGGTITPPERPEQLYVKYKTRPTGLQLEDEKLKHNFTLLKYATKGTGLIPSADNVVIVEGGNITQLKNDDSVELVERVPVDEIDQINDPLYTNNVLQIQDFNRVDYQLAMEEFGYGLEGFRPDFQPPQAAIEKTSEELMEEARREGAKTEPYREAWDRFTTIKEGARDRATAVTPGMTQQEFFESRLPGFEDQFKLTEKFQQAERRRLADRRRLLATGRGGGGRAFSVFRRGRR